MCVLVPRHAGLYLYQVRKGRWGFWGLVRVLRNVRNSLKIGRAGLK
nr:MAG TPA: hypothetical protein [Caudoviricetes sp.]